MRIAPGVSGAGVWGPTGALQRLGPGMSMAVQLPPEQDLLVTEDFAAASKPLVIT